MHESQKRALVFAPHPDDAEIGMGATIVKMLAEGWEVVIAELTNGEPTPAGSPEIRLAERDAATKIMGVKERICLGLPNRYLQVNLEYTRTIAETIRKYRPHIIFITYRPDAHPDHVHGGELVEDARFTAKLSKTTMDYEPWWTPKILYYYSNHLRVNIEPSFLVDVSAFWQKKLDAISAYRSQFWDKYASEPARAGAVLESISAQGRYLGSRINVQYAEPFFCHDLIGLNQLDSLAGI